MSKKEFTIKAYFNSYNPEYKKMTMLFLDDEIEPFTKSYLTKYYFGAQNNPIKNGEFYVKFDVKKAKVYADKSCQFNTAVQELLDQVVEMRVYIKHYNFVDKSGKKIIGWNINLISMIPSHYS